MKKVIIMSLVAVAISLGFASCSDDDEKYVRVLFTETPTTLQAFVTTHFTPEDVAYCELYRDGSYEVVMKSGVEIDFSAAGEWKKVDMNGRVLPQSVALLVNPAILDYISTNYPNNRIEEIEKKVYTNVNLIEVELENNKEILFNLDGTIYLDQNPGAPSGKSEEIKFEELPMIAQEFKNMHFPDVEVLKVEKDGYEYELELKGGVEIEFNLEGYFKSVEVSENYEGGVPMSIVGEKIAGIVSEKHPSALIEEYTKLSSYYTGEYKDGSAVEVKVGKIEYKMFFNVEDDFISENID